MIFLTHHIAAENTDLTVCQWYTY